MRTLVLIVDDDNGLRESLRAILQNEGHAVDEAADGVAALDRLRVSQQRSVVLLDCTMPAMDGRQVLEAVAADPELAQRHAFILMSASSDLHLVALDAKRLLGDRFIGVLAKPFDLEKLLVPIEFAARMLTATH
jgi:CheY-like chemotaxis protein